MINANSLDLSTDPKAIRVVKKPIELQVVFADKAHTVSTPEGDIRCEVGDAIIIGTEGEQWPIPRAEFERTYEPVPPVRMYQPGRYRKRPIVVWARRMDAPFFVNVSWGEGRLEGKPGDWLIQYGPGDYWVVRSDIFTKTYRKAEE